MQIITIKYTRILMPLCLSWARIGERLKVQRAPLSASAQGGFKNNFRATGFYELEFVTHSPTRESAPLWILISPRGKKVSLVRIFNAENSFRTKCSGERQKFCAKTANQTRREHTSQLNSAPCVSVLLAGRIMKLADTNATFNGTRSPTFA
jgi:hypothetical protein